MLNRSRRPDGWDPEAPNYFATPTALLGLWNPFLIAMAHFDGHVAEGVATLFSEWQHFVIHRLTRDMQLLQQLANCKSPDQIGAAYAEFWQRAFADYAEEFATLNKLVTGTTNKAISHMHSASEEAANTTSPVHAAA
jgi:hypothetical protein